MTYDATYRACTPLFMAGLELRSARESPPAEELRRRVLALLERAAKDMMAAGVPEPETREVRYALVAFIDEQVAASQWLGRAEWLRHPLQLQLYRENTAGENFFVRLRRLMEQRGSVSALQAYYFALALGFKGRHVGNDAGLAALLQQTKSRLAGELGRPDPTAPHVLPTDRGNFRGHNRALLWGVAAGCVFTAVGVMVALEKSLRAEIANTVGQITPTKDTRPPETAP